MTSDPAAKDGRGHTPGPWEACHGGKCKCGQIWSMPADHPVAQVTRGKWGDDYPALRFTEDSTSLHHLIEPYMEQITYSEVSAETAEANARRIVACVNACEGIADPEAFIGASRGDIADRMTADRDSLRERVKELTDMLMAIQELPDQAQASAAKHLADIALSKSPK